MTSEESLPVLHVLVVGFHHKKGCQVEYSHPPLMPEGDPHSSELPSQWRQLPALALPDGSHNFDQDTAFFHLPALDNPRKTVFGISCYRQISADCLVNKTEDITRGSVQKSVCVLSRLPLYGQIQVKMSLITEAYFREGDFTRLDLIHQTYDNLNLCLNDEMLRTQQLYVGLSARDFVLKFRQKALVLFKLMLLERKVLFMQSPVSELCSHFLTLLSLHPGMLEAGLDEAARMVPADTPPSNSPCDEEPVETFLDEETKETEVKDDDSVKGEETDEGRSSVMSTSSSIVEFASEKVSGIKGRLSGAIGYIAGYEKDEYAEPDVDGKSTDETPLPPPVGPDFQSVATLKTEELGLPLNVFTGGNLCHPYLSLSYLDILTQPSIHGYLIGATNILFRQKKGIAEVAVDIEKDKLDVLDQELKKALTLTTEDLRFIDNVIKHVGETSNKAENGEERKDVFLDGVGWEGGDEWVRAQFRFYLVCLLRSTLEEENQKLEGAKSLETASTPSTDGPSSITAPVPQVNLAHFNANYVDLWRATRNYRDWRGSARAEARKFIASEVKPGHPYAGQLSVMDMKLHLSNTISNTESGKRVSAAVMNTGKAVAGGLSSARGAFSSFLGSFKTTTGTPDTEATPAEEATEGSVKDEEEDKVKE